MIFAGVLRGKAYLCCFTQFTVDQSKLTVNGSVLSDTPNVRYLVALYMPVGPRLRPGATLHYKTRIKTWSNISFLLSLSHNSYDTNWTAHPYTSY